MKAEEMPQQRKIIKKSVKEVYEEFCVNGRKNRTYRTKQKQDSLWNNHLCQKFGKRYMEDNPISRYSKLDGMSAQFAAYPHFWYQMGSTANSIYHDSNMPDEIKTNIICSVTMRYLLHRRWNMWNFLI